MPSQPRRHTGRAPHSGTATFRGATHGGLVLQPEMGRGALTLEWCWTLGNEHLTGCRSHSEMVSDVCWAPDGTSLVSASVENLAIVWDVDSGKGKVRFENHNHFVQGVSWDPARKYVVTQSADRTCR